MNPWVVKTCKMRKKQGLSSPDVLDGAVSCASALNDPLLLHLDTILTLRAWPWELTWEGRISREPDRSATPPPPPSSAATGSSWTKVRLQSWE